MGLRKKFVEKLKIEREGSMNQYLQSVVEDVKRKHSNQREFVQTVEEVLSSVEPLVDAHPEYERFDILGRMVEPDRMFTFRVVWMDDNGEYHILSAGEPE